MMEPEQIPKPRAKQCGLGRSCLVKKGGMPSPQFLDAQRCVIFSKCNCTYHDNCYNRNKKPGIKNDNGELDFCIDNAHHNMIDNNIYQNLTWREIRKGIRDNISAADPSSSTTTSRGRPTKHVHGRLPKCGICQQQIGRDEGQKSIHADCNFHIGCYENWLIKYPFCADNACYWHDYCFEEHYVQNLIEGDSGITNFIRIPSGVDSFYCAILASMTGTMPTKEQIVHFRQGTHGLLRDIDQQSDLYPRGIFPNRAHFLEHLRRVLISTQWGPDHYGEDIAPSLTAYAEEQSREGHSVPRRGVEILASLFLGRTIVVIDHHGIDTSQDVDTTNPHYILRKLSAYFPDGIIMRENTDEDCHFSQLNAFIIHDDLHWRQLRRYPDGQAMVYIYIYLGFLFCFFLWWDTGRDLSLVERHRFITEPSRSVENPIVIYDCGGINSRYNAIHFNLPGVEGMERIRSDYTVPALLRHYIPPTEQPNTTSSMPESIMPSAVYRVRTPSDGDCFFHAILSAMTGVYQNINIGKVSRFRHDVYSLLRDIDQDFDLYPRQSFATREEFIQHLRMSLVDPNSGRNIMTESLSNIAEEMQPSANSKQERWAQINDAILASIYLGRIIVVVRPDLTVAEAQQMRPRYDSRQFRMRIQIFFPDGTIMMERMPEDGELHNLHAFTIANDERSRQVENPIVIYFNGVNHFEAIRFNVRNVDEMTGIERISNYNDPDSYQIPNILKPAQQSTSSN